jgi:hypothetical protein
VSPLGTVSQESDCVCNWEEHGIRKSLNFARPDDRVLAVYHDFLRENAIVGTNKAPIKLIYGSVSTFLEDKMDLIALQKPTERLPLEVLTR